MYEYMVHLCSTISALSVMEIQQYNALMHAVEYSLTSMWDCHIIFVNISWNSLNGCTFISSCDYISMGFPYNTVTNTQSEFLMSAGIGQGRVTQNLQGTPVDYALLIKDSEAVEMVGRSIG